MPLGVIMAMADHGGAKTARAANAVRPSIVPDQLSRKLAAAGNGREGGGWSCCALWPEEDVVSEVVEAADKVGRGSLGCLLVEERLSEFLEGNALGEPVE